MYQVIPAIIPQSKEDLLAFLQTFHMVPKVQVDVTDGVFVPGTSWPYTESADLVQTLIDLEPPEVMVDLMVKDVGVATKNWLEVGASEVVVHLESLPDLDAIISLKSTYDFRLFLTADNNVPISEYKQYGEVLDGFQLMGIDEVGVQGNSFDSQVLENLKELRSFYKQKTIVVDGGVKIDNIKSLKEAGANQFVVGSAIMKAESPLETYRAMLALVQ
ncbi:hypothetical protein CL653_02250 [bacterium]|nr:hypothetical protein [bacterium]